MMDDSIPVIDLGPFRQGDPVGTAQLARAVDEANRSVGFLVVVGHGVSEDLITEMDETTRQFFALTPEEKLQVRSTEPAASRGYMPPKSRGLAKTLGTSSPPDLVEYFSAGQPVVPDLAYFAPASAGINFRPNRWPSTPSTFESVWTTYYRRMEQLAGDLIHVFALALGLPEQWFDDSVGRHCSNMFANFYPVLTAPPEPGQLRLGAHTDYGSLTLLYQDDTKGGLQVHHDSQWVDAPHVPGAFIVNIGDLMARWTNDRWVSTLHRVQNPIDSRYDVPRLSIPFFHQPDYDALIEAIPTCVDDEHPARYEPITSGQNLEQKTRSSLTY
ncbi:MAG: efe 2 [Pseudonocardiales bacterium]|nr:efe 2 [Pseudonocardiales bacterium]